MAVIDNLPMPTAHPAVKFILGILATSYWLFNLYRQTPAIKDGAAWLSYPALLQAASQPQLGPSSSCTPSNNHNVLSWTAPASPSRSRWQPASLLSCQTLPSSLSATGSICPGATSEVCATRQTQTTSTSPHTTPFPRWTSFLMSIPSRLPARWGASVSPQQAAAAPPGEALDLMGDLLHHSLVDGAGGAVCVWLLGGSALGFAALWLLWYCLLIKALRHLAGTAQASSTAVPLSRMPLSPRACGQRCGGVSLSRSNGTLEGEPSQQEDGSTRYGDRLVEASTQQGTQPSSHSRPAGLMNTLHRSAPTAQREAPPRGVLLSYPAIPSFPCSPSRPTTQRHASLSTPLAYSPVRPSTPSSPMSSCAAWTHPSQPTLLSSASGLVLSSQEHQHQGNRPAILPCYPMQPHSPRSPGFNPSVASTPYSPPGLASHLRSRPVNSPPPAGTLGTSISSYRHVPPSTSHLGHPPPHPVASGPGTGPLHGQAGSGVLMENTAGPAAVPLPQRGHVLLLTVAYGLPVLVGVVPCLPRVWLMLGLLVLGLAAVFAASQHSAALGM